MIILMSLTVPSANNISTLAQTVLKHDYYLTMAQDETVQFSSLETPCPSTGLRLILYHVPPEIEITQTGTMAGSRTCSCCPPPVGCCEQKYAVYTIQSQFPGQYDVEFRIGRGDASIEYYDAAILHVTVTPSEIRWPWTGPAVFGSILALLALVVVFGARYRARSRRKKSGFARTAVSDSIVPSRL